MTGLKIAIVGGNGFIGRAVSARLSRSGHEVTWLARDPSRVVDAAQEAGVHTVVPFVQERDDLPWAVAVARADTVINLAGHPISDRWSTATRGRIVASRVDLTRRIVDVMVRARSRAAREGTAPRPATLVNASGIGVYGDRGDDVLRENEPPGCDWLAQVAALWEEQAMRAQAADIRVVVVRNGLVLGAEGLLPRLVLPMRLFAGGPIGTGSQWMPWIHIDDAAGIYATAATEASWDGPYNAAAPDVVTAREFAATLGSVTGRPSWAPVPTVALRAILGPGAPTMMMSQRASADRVVRAGYEFAFPELAGALRDLLIDRKVA